MSNDVIRKKSKKIAISSVINVEKIKSSKIFFIKCITINDKIKEVKIFEIIKSIEFSSFIIILNSGTIKIKETIAIKYDKKIKNSFLDSFGFIFRFGKLVMVEINSNISVIIFFSFSELIFLLQALFFTVLLFPYILQMKMYFLMKIYKHLLLSLNKLKLQSFPKHHIRQQTIYFLSKIPNYFLFHNLLRFRFPF